MLSDLPEACLALSPRRRAAPPGLRAGPGELGPRTAGGAARAAGPGGGPEMSCVRRLLLTSLFPALLLHGESGGGGGGDGSRECPRGDSLEPR